MMNEIAVIGDGIAAKTLIHYIQRKTEQKIVQIASDEFLPACSMRTTSINCLRGTQKGISKLGDLIVDSYLEFENFYEEFLPAGVEKSYEWQCWDTHGNKADQWQKRYAEFQKSSMKEIINIDFSHIEGVKSDAYIINPVSLYQWFKNQNKNIRRISAMVTKLEKNGSGWHITTSSGEEINADLVFFCTSYNTHQFSEYFSEDSRASLLDSKPVSGTYLSFKLEGHENLPLNFSQSFSWAYEGYHLIFRKDSMEVIIGSSSEDNSAIHTPNLKTANEIYCFFQSKLNNQLPDLKLWHYHTGIRHKGKQRLPRWERVNENLYSIWGLYKNAFTFSFLASKELSERYF